MICKFCGNRIEDDAMFCSRCGKRVEETIDYFDESNFVNPKVEEEKSRIGGSILGCAIAGVVLLLVSCTGILVASEVAYFIGYDAFLRCVFGLLIVNIVGWIFSATARGKARGYAERFGETNGKATVGKIMSIPALILNIIFAVLYTILIVVLLGL